MGSGDFTQGSYSCEFYVQSVRRVVGENKISLLKHR